MQNSILLFALAVIAAVFVISCEAAHDHHDHGGGGGGGSDHHSGGGGSHHHHHDGGGGGGHHHHHSHHYDSGSSFSGSDISSSSGGSGYGGGGFLTRLLFGGLFRRPSYYPSYYGYGNYNRGYCRIAQFVDYVGRTPRYYCDCPPYPPNYQWNQCVPMNSYGKK